MKRIAVYAGTFDPVTYGHLDLIERSSKMFDELVVGIGVNSSKNPLLSLRERMALLKLECEKFENVMVTSFDGLLIDFARASKATTLVRGLRAAMDFEYELGICQANRTQDKTIDTVFLATSPEFSFVSSSIVKEICKHGGIVRQFVSHNAERVLWEKFGFNDALRTKKTEEPQGSP